MSQDRELFELVRHPMRVRKLQVVRVRELTPRMRRITLGGSELSGFVSLAPEDHVKLFFPEPGESEPRVPTLGPLGVILPTLGKKPIGRDYTPRRHDPEVGELEIDFLLHGSGVASLWAAQAKPGDTLGVAGPRGSFVLKRNFPCQLFVGDETALPEFARRLESLPPGSRAHVVMLVSGQAEETLLSSAEGVDVTWLQRPSTEFDASNMLLDCLRGLELDSASTFAWLAGEASEIRAVHRHLVRERGLPARGQVRASGHWKRGVVNHDHHEAID